MRIHADPYPGQTLIKSQKLKFFMKNILKVGTLRVIGQHTQEGTKAFLKDKKPGLFVNFGQFSCSGFGSELPMGIQIQDTQI
jgi:hypothetical protein